MVSQFSRFKWPTYRQVAHSTPVPEVKVIQFLLRNQGFFKRQPDGIFHADTASSVRAFQRAKGLKVDGIVGSQTWKPLLLRLKKGDRGDAVRALQTILRETTGHEAQYLTRDLPVDGVFGAETEKALRIAQDEANWFEKRAVVDGIAGPQIWSILLDGKYQP
jgi:peptidoglycan hydrolase-like protein with peptidoglycan-binding domain